jgi:hypothetical protein
MKEVRKIIHKIILLVTDILVFTYQIVREIILPTRRRKGNILSSVLAFFVGLVERVVSFENSLLQQPVVFSHKYVRKGLVIAVGFLFLLSSVEWTVGQTSDVAVNEAQAVVTSEPTADGVTFLAQRQGKATIQISAGHFFFPVFLSYRSPYALFGDPVAVKRWLRLCVFLI